jgi:hypothetical protein
MRFQKSGLAKVSISPVSLSHKTTTAGAVRHYLLNSDTPALQFVLGMKFNPLIY